MKIHKDQVLLGLLIAVVLGLLGNSVYEGISTMITDFKINETYKVQ